MSSNLQNAAIVFMQKNLAQHLSGDRQLLVNRCVDHLLNISDVPAGKAERISLQALGEVEVRGMAYIDMAATSDHSVVVQFQKTGEAFVFTVASLMMLAKMHAIPINRH